MMLPARTVSLPNFFTPRRLLSLSRPLRDEPPAFLCAMSNYFAFGVFLAAALAGAAFFVEAALAGFAAGAFFAAGFSAPAVSSLSGAGLSVGVPTISFDRCWSAVASADSFARAEGLLSAGAAPPLAAALGAAPVFRGGFFCSLWSPMATILRIVCCWRWPFLRR